MSRERQKESPYAFAYFVLNDKRDRLYQRIDARIDEMLLEGLVAEVEKLKEKGATAVWFRCRDLAIKRSWSIWTENVPLRKQL